MAKHVFDKTTYDQYAFVKNFSRNDFIILLQYVSDIFIIGCDFGNINIYLEKR